MKTIIRKESTQDHAAVHTLIQQAFAKEKYSDKTEHFLVDRLRESKSFIPELSLVAENEGKHIGHILLTRLSIKPENKTFRCLALAPVSVLPQFQNKGIGTALINESHRLAKAMGYSGIILIGHENYYKRFGYKELDQNRYKLPFEIPKENCFYLELNNNSTKNSSGTIIYDPAFFA
jgi:predicted N-acetyltransferase YhbS